MKREREKEREDEPPDHLLQRPRRTIDRVVGLVELKRNEREGSGQLELRDGKCKKKRRREETHNISRVLDLFSLTSKVSEDISSYVLRFQCQSV